MRSPTIEFMRYSVGVAQVTRCCEGADSIVNGLGAAWLIAGAVSMRAQGGTDGGGPAISLCVLLAFFRLVLRPGISFLITSDVRSRAGREESEKGIKLHGEATIVKSQLSVLRSRCWRQGVEAFRQIAPTAASMLVWAPHRFR